MRVLFDQGTPKPLKQFLAGHDVTTAFKMGWSKLSNGVLLNAAENAGFDLLLTTDKNLRYQQNLRNRRIAIVVLPTTSWRELKNHSAEIATAVGQTRPGSYRELTF